MNLFCDTIFWVLSVMDYRRLISEAGLRSARSASLLWVAERPHHHHHPSSFKAGGDSSSACLVTLSRLITHSAFLPSDCQCLKRLFTLTEAQTKDTTQNKKGVKKKDMNFGYVNVTQKHLECHGKSKKEIVKKMCLSNPVKNNLLLFSSNKQQIEAVFSLDL